MSRLTDKAILNSYSAKFTFVQHGPWISGAYKQHCAKCGLVNLNNKLTAWAIKHGCNNRDHPDYDRVRKSLI